MTKFSPLQQKKKKRIFSQKCFACFRAEFSFVCVYCIDQIVCLRHNDDGSKVKFTVYAIVWRFLNDSVIPVVPVWNVIEFLNHVFCILVLHFFFPKIYSTNSMLLFLIYHVSFSTLLFFFRFYFLSYHQIYLHRDKIEQINDTGIDVKTRIKTLTQCQTKYIFLLLLRWSYLNKKICGRWKKISVGILSKLVHDDESNMELLK